MFEATTLKNFLAAAEGTFFVDDVGFVDNASYANNRRIRWNVFKHNGVCADFDVVANGYVAQNFCACAYYHVVAQRGMAFVMLLARSAQGCALVNRAVITDDGGLTDNYAHAVVDEQIFADFCAGVDFDTRKKPAQLRQQSSQKTQVYYVEKMRNAMPNYRMHARVQQKDFQRASCGRISLFY